MAVLGEIDAAEAAIGLGGRFPRCLFAAFSNISPGVEFERFQRWYFDVHRPDSLELGLFTRSLRFEAASASQMFVSDDMTQGYKAMAEKRDADFEGK